MPYYKVSGHGGQTIDYSGEESDGEDQGEPIVAHMRRMIINASLIGVYPVDYLQSEPKGMLIDDVSLCKVSCQRDAFNV